MYSYRVNSSNNYLQVDDPLDQAVKFLQPLQTLCSDLLETHLMAYEIYSRKGTHTACQAQVVNSMHTVALLVMKILLKE